ncbi:MAG: CehA/McbA family metallohydrolase [Acidobacteria bacterium]|nr:CehA/McbA family metallohydrolase [Acidobacteriota bacterium]
MNRRAVGLRPIAIALFFSSLVLEGAAQIPPAFPAAKTGGNYMHNYYLPPPSSTPFSPAWSPGGEEIVFSMQGSLWRIKVGDSVAYELTAGSTYDSSPDWSPDGRWIVYTAEEDSRAINLMLLDLQRGETQPLTTGSHLNLDPRWSPNGTRIAYVSTHPNGYFNIFILPVENGQAGEPIQVTQDNRDPNSRLYFGEHDLHIQPTWSPDGRELIGVSNQGIPLGSGAIWRFPAEANGFARAQMVHREETLYRTRPDWSPDGTRILYSAHLGGEHNNLFVLPAAGGEPYKLTFGDWDHFHPRWSPDGQQIIYVSNQHGLTDLRILETFGGREQTVEIRERRYKRPMGWLEVRVVDEETGEPTPARIYAQASDGKTYVPDDAFHRVGRLREHLFHTTGTFTLRVPPGRMRVEVVKGFEYWPASQEVTIQADTVTTATLVLKRMTNLPRTGWYSGSNHVHMNYGGNLRNMPTNLLFMAAAEDTAVVGELIANKDNRVLDTAFFRGALDLASTPDRLLYFNQEYRPPFYGHISFINLKKHLISPFTTGYEGTAIESLYPSNTDMFRLARQQGAIGGYVHPFSSDPATSDYGRARGLPVDVALGVVDYLELMSGSDHVTTAGVWHRLLNCGFKISATAGEDSISDLHRAALVGANRTYAYLGPRLDYELWVEAIRQGKTFVTNGPLLEFAVNDAGIGKEIRLAATGGTVILRGQMQSIVPVEKLEVFYNGEVVASIPLTEGGKKAEFHLEKVVARSGWFTLRAYSGRPVHPIDDRYPFAETGPIYAYCGNQPIRSRTDADYFIRWIDAITQMAEEHPGWRSEKEKQYVLEQFSAARDIFVQRRQEAP